MINIRHDINIILYISFMYHLLLLSSLNIIFEIQKY